MTHNKNKNNLTYSVQGEEIFGEFTSSFETDIHLFEEDIEVSIAYSKMLKKIGILNQSENLKIIDGLNEIKSEILKGTFKWDYSLEDIHMNIESSLYAKIGNVAGKLHTGRSRNDQIVTDSRLYFKKKTKIIIQELLDLLKVLVVIADNNKQIIMPGYTHLQKGQPVLLSHSILAYFSILYRDYERFRRALLNIDFMPLGSGAFAGVNIPIDQNFLQNELGFSQKTSNSIDAVSSRDFILDLLYASSSLMINFSRICEEFIIWNTYEFNFISLPEKFTTGSSIMPQKKNPDFLELIRAKAGTNLGTLLSLFTTLKGLPFTYNRDLQEDRKGAIQTTKTVIESIKIIKEFLSEMKFNSDQMFQSAENSNILATDFADYLASKNIPFREAYNLMKEISNTLKKTNRNINDLSLEDFQKISPIFTKDVMKITIKSSIENRNSFGGTSTKSINNQIKDSKNLLNKISNEIK